MSSTHQILLVNSLSAGSRPKKELIDRVAHLPLFTPTCLLPDAAAPAVATAAPQPATPVGTDAMAALGWLAPSATAAAATSLGGGSCCALPPVRIRLLEGMQAPAAAQARAVAAGLQQQAAAAPAAAAPQSLPADSQATMASASGGAVARAVQVSPEVAQQQRQQVAHPQQHAPLSGQALEGSGSAGLAPSEKEEEEDLEPPAWLVQGIAAVADRSQGSHGAAEGHQLLGRRVAFVLLQDFEQDDPSGALDAVEAGVLEGQ